MSVVALALVAGVHAMSVTKLKLWSSAACPYAQRARIALEESGVSYDLVIEDLSAKSEGFIAAYAEANPGGRAKVPVLEVDDLVICESLVITEYVAETAWAHNLSPEQRAIARLMVEVSPFSGYFEVLKARYDADDLADAVSAFAAKIGNFEKFLSKHAAGPFLFEDFCFAEAAIAPFVKRSVLCLNHFIDVDIRDVCQFRNCPRTLAFVEACLERPSVLTTSLPDEEYIAGTKALLARFDEAARKAREKAPSSALK
ncbi:hypothetical protein CTAYLR_007796 [Chrysophaeum taylorii]|uniref:GST N-terminal domain-containing protein n=1 Tax=Chrysophaeum taylorii TaxID=2483200 RepID=A0AAD7XPL6_9STRA|nr:hypothetical protein CTAYLR_007796 [Chrysophaeum taylorii]